MKQENQICVCGDCQNPAYEGLNCCLACLYMLSSPPKEATSNLDSVQETDLPD